MMDANHLTIRDARPGEEDEIQRVVSSVLQEFGFSANFAGLDSDLIDVAESYRKRGGVFRVIVGADDRIVGCGGLYPLTTEEVELRKMYLLPSIRGRGLGLALLDDLVGSARERRFERIVLETAVVLHDAIALYRRYGFVQISRPHLGDRCDLAFALELGERESNELDGRVH